MITQHMVISSSLITRAIEYGLNQTMTKQQSQKKTAAGRKARPEGIALNLISEGNKNFKRKSWAHWYSWNVSGEARMPFPQSCQDPQRTEMHFTSEMELHAKAVLTCQEHPSQHQRWPVLHWQILQWNQIEQVWKIGEKTSTSHLY